MVFFRDRLRCGETERDAMRDRMSHACRTDEGNLTKKDLSRCNGSSARDVPTHAGGAARRGARKTVREQICVGAHEEPDTG